MTANQVVKKMAELGDSKKQESFARNTKSSETCYGLSISEIKKMAKEIGRNHKLALSLWKKEVHEAKLLATLIAEFDKVQVEELDEQVQRVYTFDVSNYFVNHLVSKTSFTLDKANDWTDMNQSHLVRRTGYRCVAALAKKSKILDNNYFLKHLMVIEFGFEYSSDWVKEGQAHALIAIGSRNKLLHKKALAVANKIKSIPCTDPIVCKKFPDYLAKLNNVKFDK